MRRWPWARTWWPRGFLGRPSPGTCSASIRRTTPGCVAWSRRPSPGGSRGCAPGPVRRGRPPRRSRRAGPETRADLVAAFAFLLLFTVICELGVPEPDRGPLGRGLVALLVPTPTPAAYARAKEASDAVVAMLEALVEAKRSAPADDLVSGLLSARDGDECLDEQELLSTIFQLIVAGHDTTSSLIGNSVVALLRYPDQLAQLCGPRQDSAAVEMSPRRPRLRRRDVLVRSGRAGGARRRDRPSAGAQVITAWRPPTGTAAGTTARRFSTSAGPRRSTSGSGTASTTASVPHWPAWRAGPALASLRRFPGSARSAHRRPALDHGDGLVLRGLSVLPVILRPSAGARLQAGRRRRARPAPSGVGRDGGRRARSRRWTATSGNGLRRRSPRRTRRAPRPPRPGGRLPGPDARPLLGSELGDGAGGRHHPGGVVRGRRLHRGPGARGARLGRRSRPRRLPPISTPDGMFLVEQQAYFGAENGRISWLRILCSGFRAIGGSASA